MIQIAIVEDDASYQNQLLGYLHRYEKQYGEQFRISVYSDGLDIIEANLNTIDIILMDIQMRNMDGMKAGSIFCFLSNAA